MLGSIIFNRESTESRFIQNITWNGYGINKSFFIFGMLLGVSDEGSVVTVVGIFWLTGLDL